MDFYIHDPDATPLDGWHQRWAAMCEGRCECPPAVIALIAASAAIGTGGAIAANKGTKNSQAIKGLEQAQATGNLTSGDQMTLNAQQAQLQRRADEAAAQEANILAQHGATSGRDAQAIMGARQTAQGDIADKATQAAASLFSGEKSELEARRAVRRDRNMEIVNFWTEGLDSLAGAMGGNMGATDKGTTGKLNLTSADMEAYESLSDEDKAAFNAKYGVQ